MYKRQKESYPQGPSGVIIAKSTDFPDALAASTLAGAKGYPILLNPSDSLSPELRTYLSLIHISWRKSPSARR